MVSSTHFSGFPASAPSTASTGADGSKAMPALSEPPAPLVQVSARSTVARRRPGSGRERTSTKSSWSEASAWRLAPRFVSRAIR